MMDLTWYILGALTGTAAYAGVFLLRKYSPRWPLLAGLGAGVFLVFFSIAWSVGAVLEGVPRAGSMGMLLFGLPGIVILTLTGRMIVSRGVKDQ